MKYYQSIGTQVVHVTDYRQNCTIVACLKTKNCAVIDPGGDVKVIMAEVERQGLTIEKILVTHGHVDHCGGARELRNKTGAPIIGPHRDDEYWINNVPQDNKETSLDRVVSFVPDRWLKDGDKIHVGKTSWKALHCPGHTPGHVVYYNSENNFAQVGDVLFRKSIGRTDFPRGSFKVLAQSITKKLWPLGDVDFISGHDPGLIFKRKGESTFKRERRTNPYVADIVLGTHPIFRPLVSLALSYVP